MSNQLTIKDKLKVLIDNHKEHFAMWKKFQKEWANKKRFISSGGWFDTYIANKLKAYYISFNELLKMADPYLVGRQCRSWKRMVNAINSFPIGTCITFREFSDKYCIQQFKDVRIYLYRLALCGYIRTSNELLDNVPTCFTKISDIPDTAIYLLAHLNPIINEYTLTEAPNLLHKPGIKEFQDYCRKIADEFFKKPKKVKKTIYQPFQQVKIDIPEPEGVTTSTYYTPDDPIDTLTHAQEKLVEASADIENVKWALNKNKPNKKPKKKK